MGQWELENQLASAILGVLLMIYSELVVFHASQDNERRSLLVPGHAIIIWILGIVLLARFVVALLGG